MVISLRRAAPIAALLLAAALTGAHAIDLPPAAQAASRATTGTTVHYNAGWNIVAAPTGTSLDAATGPLLAASPAVDGLLAEQQSEVVGGRAVWAYFADGADVTLGPTAATFTQMLTRADHYALIGNPSTTQTLPIHGADLAYSYDPQQGFQPVTQLKPGQGAYVLSYSGGWITVGDPPSADLGAQLRELQTGLTNDAADVATFGKVPALAQGLLSARQYDVVQASMDDLRAAFADGLAKEAAASQPQLTPTQMSNAASIRELLAEAQEAVNSGTLTMADSLITKAQTLAQASEDEAASIARSQASSAPQSGASALYLQASYTPQSLARYGDLCFATVPALALNLPPSDQFGALVVAVLNNQPVS